MRLVTQEPTTPIEPPAAVPITAQAAAGRAIATGPLGSLS